MTAPLDLLAPPLVGAFIGYVTNHIAIRMLFRPLKPWRILGLRVPLTPGVIPAKRHELAENIGRMVGGHLLTGEDVSRAVTSDSCRREIEALVTERLDRILGMELGPLESIIPERFRSYFEVGVKILRWRALKHLHTHLAGEDFAAGLTADIAAHLKRALARTPAQAFPQGLDLLETVEGIVTGLMSGPAARNWLETSIGARFDALATDTRPTREVVPAALIELFSNLINQESPTLVRKASGLLAAPERRDALAALLGRAILQFLGNLGPLGALAGGLLSADSITARVRESLESRRDDLGQLLLGDSADETIRQFLQERFQTFLSTPIRDLFVALGPQRGAAIRAGAISRLVALLQDEKTIHACTVFAREALEGQSRRPVAELGAAILGPLGFERGIDWLATEIVSLLRSADVRRILDATMVKFVEESLLTRPIGPLSAILPQAVQSAIAETLVRTTIEVLVQEVPGIVDTMNIERIVSRKVDSLDLLRLEELLLGIMREQFKYINLMGGLLGFLIGLVNLLLL